MENVMAKNPCNQVKRELVTPNACNFANSHSCGNKGLGRIKKNAVGVRIAMLKTKYPVMDNS